jgi:DnaJ-class molecular chaperone
MRRDLYEVLGIAPTAADGEIKAAYRKLARKLHPDVNPGDKKAEETFKGITEAYQVLSDKKKRAQYDQLRQMGIHRGPRGGGRGGFDFSAFHSGEGGIEDLLSELFGREFGGFGGRPGGGPRGGMRGEDYETAIDLSFKEAVLGAEKSLDIVVPRSCPGCRGLGASSRGTRCAACGGRGTKASSEKVRVRIPPGVENGQRIRVPGKGGAGRAGGPPGSLYLLPRVASSRIFTREGRDVVLDLPVTLAEALLGAKVQVPTLTGQVTMSIPAGSQGGQKFKLAGKGVPATGRRGAGNQIVQLRVSMPRRLDARSRELIREFDERNPDDPRESLLGDAARSRRSGKTGSASRRSK